MAKTCALVSLFLILLVLSPYQSWSQGYYDAEYDMKSYEAFMEKDWQKIIQLAKEAEKKGIDFYYLRLRKGIAYDNQEKYNSSEREYKKANAFFPVDTLTYWYRYVSLMNAGRESEARVLSSHLTPWQKFYSGFKGSRLNWIGLEGGGLFGKAPEASLTDPTQVYLKQKQQGNLFFASGSANMWIGSRMNFTLGYQFMNVGNTIIFSRHLGTPGSGNKQISNQSWKLKTNQQSIYAGLNYQFGKGWSVFASGNIIFYSGNTVQIDTILGSTLSFRIKELNISGMDLSLVGLVRKRWSNFSWESSYSFNRVSDSLYHQSNTILTLFPIGNNRIYISGQASTISQSGTNFFGGFKLGARFSKWLWLEGNCLFGRMYGTSDASGWILNNNPDQINWKAGIHFSFILKNKFEIPLRFGLLGREGLTFKEIRTNSTEIPIEKGFPYTYTHFLINTGLKIYF